MLHEVDHKFMLLFFLGLNFCRHVVTANGIIGSWNPLHKVRFSLFVFITLSFFVVFFFYCGGRQIWL